MHLLFWTLVCVVLTSSYLTSVTSQNATAPSLCCPARENRNEVHVHCTGKALPSFVWSKHAAVWFAPETKEMCMQEKGGSGTRSDSPSVLWLDVSHNVLTVSPDISHGSLSSLYHLNLSHNQIEKISSDAFLSVQSLRCLDLSFNRLGLVPDFSQAHLHDLTFLNLSHNSLQWIPGHSLQDLSKLDTLVLSHNKISDVASESFADLSSLRLLMFRSNVMESFPPGVFDELSHLLELDLSDNVLTSLPKNIFHSLSQLKVLNLSDNSLNEIPVGTFQRLSNLRTLDLSANHMNNISGGIFEGLEKLDRLKLPHNKVKAITVDTFKGLKSLKNLDLSHNQLATIRKASFMHVKILNQMFLNSNHLKRLHEHVFAGLQWLEVLDISDNQLQLDSETLPDDLFTPLQRLISLRLHGNDVRTEGTYPANVFTSLVNMRHLSIDTFSTTVFGQEFSALSHLRKLELPNCRMTTLTKDTFRGLRQSLLEQLRMSACPLRKVEECAFCGLHNLERLSVTDSSHPSPVELQDKLLDAHTTDLRHLNLSNMNLQSHSLQALADHMLKNLDKLEVLDLSWNNLTDMNITLNGRLKKLLLSGNRFQTIPVNLTNFKRLVLLDISQNNVSYLPQRESLDKLAENPEFTLRLHGNQLACPSEDCSNKDFLAWMFSTRVRLDDGQTSGREYPCFTNKGKTVTTTVDDAHAECTRRTNAVQIFGSLLALMGTLFVIWFVRRTLRQRNERSPAAKYEDTKTPRELQSDEIIPDSSLNSKSSSSGEYSGGLSLSSFALRPKDPTQTNCFLECPVRTSLRSCSLSGSSSSGDPIMSPTDFGFQTFSTLSSSVRVPQVSSTLASASRPSLSPDYTQTLVKQRGLVSPLRDDDSSVFLSQRSLTTEAERLTSGTDMESSSSISTVFSSYGEDVDIRSVKEQNHNIQRKRQLDSPFSSLGSSNRASHDVNTLKHLDGPDRYSQTHDAGEENFVNHYNRIHQTQPKEVEIERQADLPVSSSMRSSAPVARVLPVYKPQIPPQQSQTNERISQHICPRCENYPPPSYNTACKEPDMSYRVTVESRYNHQRRQQEQTQ